MLDKEQSEAVAEALFLPDRERQNASQLRKETQRLKRISLRRAAFLGFFGLVLGGAFSYMLYGRIFPLGLIGMSIGFALGYFITRRAP